MVMTRATAPDDTDRSVTDDAADTHESAANDAAGSATDGAAGGATDGAVAESAEVEGSDVRAAILGYSTKYELFGERQEAYRNIWRSARQNTLHIEAGAFALPPDFEPKTVGSEPTLVAKSAGGRSGGCNQAGNDVRRRSRQRHKPGIQPRTPGLKARSSGTRSPILGSKWVAAPYRAMCCVPRGTL
jgi:hypothetical protein